VTLPTITAEAKECSYDIDIAVRYNQVTWKNQRENVKNIQRIIGLTEDKNNQQNNQVDGYWGKITTQKIMDFQRQHGLTPDGRV